MVVCCRDLGLAQHSSAFEKNSVDGRVLSVITKKEADKYLGVSKKQHLVSCACACLYVCVCVRVGVCVCACVCVCVRVICWW